MTREWCRQTSGIYVREVGIHPSVTRWEIIRGRTGWVIFRANRQLTICRSLKLAKRLANAIIAGADPMAEVADG